MVSKSKVKFIRSLIVKKHRHQAGCFIVEGEKMVEDLLHRDWEILEIYAQPEWIEKFIPSLPSIRIYEVNLETLKKISSLTTPHRVLAIVKIPQETVLPEIDPDDLVLALDGIQDPGNMGTILRIASWFGIKTVLNSHGCVDVYNPKVVQASMSAIFDVRAFTVHMEAILEDLKPLGIRIFGTFPEGHNIYHMDLPNGGIILLGNEAKGISESLLPFIDHRISIPAAPGHENRSVESLNVATAASIVCSEFYRRFN